MTVTLIKLNADDVVSNETFKIAAVALSCVPIVALVVVVIRLLKPKKRRLRK